ncbi:MAG: hypothetical protein GX801_10770 [Fibrobacter sp.]|nr:hypothetical protein [Fibrobacter sp.]
MKPIDITELEKALQLVNDILVFRDGDPYHLVVCGGSALIALGLVARATKDVDILALKKHDLLVAPTPLPQDLSTASLEVHKHLKLPEDWLNNGPSSSEGGLFQLGLPSGLEQRLVLKKYGEKLTVSFIGRLDQIFFKLWAAVDQGGYHIEDLLALSPTSEELLLAAQWSCEKDVSAGYLLMLKNFLSEINHDHIADRLA